MYSAVMHDMSMILQSCRKRVRECPSRRLHLPHESQRDTVHFPTCGYSGAKEAPVLFERYATAEFEEGA